MGQRRCRVQSHERAAVDSAGEYRDRLLVMDHNSHQENRRQHAQEKTQAVRDEIRGIWVLDRTALILYIFSQRAQSREGKLQVELAQLQHLATRLVRGWSHLERQRGEAPNNQCAPSQSAQYPAAISRICMRTFSER